LNAHNEDAHGRRDARGLRNAAGQETLAVTAKNLARTRKVLLVDDSVTTLFMGQVILGTAQHVHVLTAVDGEEAVRIALEEKPDLIVMDAVMPRMNGLQACRAIRLAAETREIPIILVTSRGEDDSEHGGYASGCTGYITKPFQSDELLALVKEHLG
jgi:DNA-binding response OmpR family regulator